MEFEVIAADQMTFEIEMIVDRGMNGGEFLERLRAPEFRHCSLSSPERLM